MTKVQNYTKTMQDRGEWTGAEGPNVGKKERLISGVGGGLLLATSLLLPAPAALLGGLVGAGLLARGVTGVCPLYRAMRRSTAPTAAKDHGLVETPSRAEAMVDDTLDDSFPASDPPAHW
jgi:uncharacterized membrane protein